MECPLLNKCGLFKMLREESLKSVLKRIYCQDRFFECEIKKKISRDQELPQGLLPNGKIIHNVM